MSELLPNLDGLKDCLPSNTAGQRDAHLLADAVADVATEDELDAVLDDLIASWRQR